MSMKMHIDMVILVIIMVENMELVEEEEEIDLYAKYMEDLDTMLSHVGTDLMEMFNNLPLPPILNTTINLLFSVSFELWSC